MAEQNRWGTDNLHLACWAPWRKYRDADDADGDLPEGVPVEEVKRETKTSRIGEVSLH